MAIIYLYDSEITNFTYNGRPLSKAYDVRVQHYTNSEFYVTGKHPIDKDGLYKEIKEDRIVKVHTPDGMKPFRIMDPIKTMNYVEFEAWPLLYADMRNKLINPLTLRQVSGQQAINAFVSNLLLDTPFSFTTNINDVRDYHTQDENERENNPHQLYDALEVLKDIINRWNGELVINGYDVRILKRIGEEKQALLYEKKNITDFVDKSSVANIVTRLHGKSEWTEQVEGGDSIERTIQTTIDSPLIDAYNGIVFEKQYTNNNIRTEQELKNWLNLKFSTENIDKPTRSIELGTNIIEDEEINLGDGLVLKYLKHDVDMQIRMIGYEYDGYSNRYIKIYLGNAKETFTGSVSNAVSNVNNNMKQQSEQIANIIINQQGVKIVYSSVEPEGNFRDGDIWFDDDGGMFQYDSKQADWIPHPYNRRMDIAEQQVLAAQQAADEAKQDAETKTAQALLDAKEYADQQDAIINQELTAEVEQAIQTSEEAKQQALDSYTDAVAEAENLVEAQKEIYDLELKEMSEGIKDIELRERDAQSGTEIFTDQADDGGVVHVEVDGKSYQHAGSGKNLFTAQAFVDQSGTIYYESNGHALRIKGVDGAGEPSYTKLADLKPNTKYVMSFSEAMNDRFILRNASGGIALSKSWVHDRSIIAFETGGDTASIVGKFYPVNQNYPKDVFVQIEEGAVATAYEPPAPSPDYPIPIESLNNFDVVSSVGGRNLALNSNNGGEGWTSTEYNVIQGYLSEDWVVGETYTVTIKGTVNSGQFFGIWRDSAQVPLVQRMTPNDDRTIWTGTAIARETTNVSKNRFAVYNVASSGAIQADVEWIKIEKGSTATPYSLAPEDIQSGETTDTISKINLLLDEPLRSVGDVKDRLFRDADGLWKVERNVGEIVLDGTESDWRMRPADESGLNVFDTYQVPVRYSINDGNLNLSKSTHYTYTGLASGIIPVQTRGLGYSLYNNHQAVPLIYVNDYSQTVAEFKNKLQTSPVRILVALREPTTETLPTEQQELLDNLASFKDSNHVYTTTDLQPTLHARFMSTGWATQQKMEYEIIKNKNEIGLRVTKGGLLTEVNVQAGRMLINTGKLVLDADTYIMGTTFVNDIKAKSLEAVEANITSIRAKILTADVITSTHLKSDTAMIEKLFATTANINVLTAKTAFISSIQAIDISAARITSGTINTARLNATEIVAQGLTANVVTSTHIKSDTALIDKLFATDANVQRLTAKTAFINSIKAISISADKITAGTLNASNVNIINLNTSHITGLNSNFITSQWNANGSDVRITGTGILTTADDGSQTYIQNGIVGTRNPAGATIGQLGYKSYEGSPNYTLETSTGANFMIRHYAAHHPMGMIYSIRVYPGADEMYLGTSRIYATGELLARAGLEVGSSTLAANLTMYEGSIVNPYGINFKNGLSIYTTTGDLSRFDGNAATIMQFRINGVQKFRIDATRNYMNQILNMQGNQIVETSDARLKTNIRPSTDDILSKLKQVEYVDYQRLDSGIEEQGFIAQQVQKVAPELIQEEPDGMLTYGLQPYIHFIGRATQQLAFEHQNLFTIVSGHTDILHTLQQELSKANKRIEELERAL